MLVELAIGDAYGAGFEYANEMLQYNNLSKYVAHPKHNIGCGRYTDDTQMSIALAELLVSGEEWSEINLCNKFVECFKRDKRKGYAAGFQWFLENINSGQEFIQKISSSSDKSGAAMRSCPLGVVPLLDEMLHMTQLQASITHNTKNGIEAAFGASLLSHYCIYQERYGNHSFKPQIKNVGRWINSVLDDCGSYERQINWDENYEGKVKSKGWMSVMAAITAVKRNNTLTGLLKDCIDFSGDVDTVAAIALGAAANCKEYDNDLIGHNLYYCLENGTYGREYLEQLDIKLKGIIK